jgi:hypothetical protein
VTEKTPYLHGCACGTGHPVRLDVPQWPDICVQRLMERVDTLTSLLLLARDCLLTDSWKPWPVSATTLIEDIRRATANAPSLTDEP